jgi:type II secretory pathway pseudopilin PulG
VSGLSLAALFVLATLVVAVVCAAVFLRLRDGKYAEALVARAMGIRRLRRHAIRSYVRDLEKTNPEAARALEKLERACGPRASPPGEAALSVLSDSERRAYLQLFDDQARRAQNRAQRRHSRGSAQKPYGLIR